MRTLTIEPLTKEAFAPFGDVIETDGSDHFMINNGSTMRFHKLATVETAKPEAGNARRTHLRRADQGTGPDHPHIRLNVFPDGGVSRLRVLGKVAK